MSTNIWNSRTELLLGEERLQKLNNANVLIVGLGGVGAAAAEMIARSGIGKVTIVDGDIVEASNRNRQLGALISTDGKAKAEAVGARMKDINADLDLTIINKFLEDQEFEILLKANKFDYVMDCIDTVTPKLYLIMNCLELGIPLISSMGAGGKIDPLQVRIANIEDSYNCKLARYVRKRLQTFDSAKGFKVVYSPEEIDKTRVHVKEGMKNKRSVIGTISFLPPIFGATCASVVIRELMGEKVELSPRPAHIVETEAREKRKAKRDKHKEHVRRAKKKKEGDQEHGE
jgi:tRNA A37 threonylcarbamoyladenosine dehydratase